MIDFLRKLRYNHSSREAFMNLLDCTNLSAEDQVLKLAKEHAVLYNETALDIWGGHVTRLADDQVSLDVVENMIVALSREKIINPAQAVSLHAQYLQEKAYV